MSITAPDTPPLASEEDVEALANDVAGMVADNVHQAIFDALRATLNDPAARANLRRILDGGTE